VLVLAQLLQVLVFRVTVGVRSLSELQDWPLSTWRRPMGRRMSSAAPWRLHYADVRTTAFA